MSCLSLAVTTIPDILPDQKITKVAVPQICANSEIGFLSTVLAVNDSMCLTSLVKSAVIAYICKPLWILLQKLAMQKPHSTAGVHME